MTPYLLARTAIVPLASLLPARLVTPSAVAMLLAVAHIETALKTRHQIGDGNRPVAAGGRGWWQFERGNRTSMGGIFGVINHSRAAWGLPYISQLGYFPNAVILYPAVEHNDVLAALLARMLLYCHPKALPGPDQPDLAWEIYLRQWNPGKPGPERWPAAYQTAWSTADQLVVEGHIEGLLV